MPKAPRQPAMLCVTLAALALYTGVSLWLFSTGNRSAAVGNGRTPPEAAVPSGVAMRSAVSDKDPLLHRFAWEPSFGALERVRALDLRLTSPRRLTRCTVQIALTADHHGVFTHTLQDQTLDGGALAVRVPLRDADGLWHADGHAAGWSDWEAATVRRVEVKVFTAVPVRDRLTLLWTPRAVAGGAAPVVRWVRPLQPEIALGERFELAFDLAGWTGNAFDNRQLDVRLRMTAPDGTLRESRAFLYQSYETRATPTGEVCGPTGVKHLRARMRPMTSGDHAWALALYGAATNRELARGICAVAAGRAPDFIRVSTAAPRYFEHADGRFFYPIGWTLLCPVDTPHGERYLPYLPARNTLREMDAMLAHLAASGANCTRIWLADWWLGLEWNAAQDCYLGLGRYNLKHAWMLDRILDACEERGVRVILETMNHYRTRRTDNYGGVWPANPYNVENGGFLNEPEDFWFDDRVLPFESRRLGYIAARYADSPAIHSWQYASESDLASNCDWRSNWSRVEPRIAGLLNVLRREDTYGHPCGTHVADLPRARSFAKRRAADLLTGNAYASRAAQGILSEEQVEAMAVFARACEALQKPALVTEFGGRWLVEPNDVRRRDLLGGLWAGVASPLSGAPLAWWWNLIYGEDLGSYWRAVSRFMAGEDLRVEDAAALGRWLSRAAACRAPGSPCPGVVMVGNDRRRYAFVYNPETVCRTRLQASVCRAATLSCAGLQPGRYAIEFWDPRTGLCVLTRPADVSDGGAVEIPLPDFTESWMLKFVPAVAAPTAGAKPAVAAVPPAAAAAPAPADDRDDGKNTAWSWRIEPLLDIVATQALPSCTYEAHVALPDAWRDRVPLVRDRGGRPVACHLARLNAGAGWRLRLPATGGETPFDITAVAAGAGSPLLADDPGPRGGLRYIAAPLAAPDLVYNRPEPLVQAFDGLPLSAGIRVGRVDQVDNPMGSNDGYRARYSGPLIVPAGGACAFAVNSDDGCAAFVDGRPVAAWMGRHDMEVQNRPMVNTWEHRGRVDLQAGVHWLAYYHYDTRGAQLARLGWVPPRTADPALRAWTGADDAGGGTADGFETVADAYLDGRVPCRLVVLAGGRPVADVVPTATLRLRRPRADVVRAAVRARGSGTWTHLSAAQPGRAWCRIDNLATPVWLDLHVDRPFSMDTEQVSVSGDGAALRVHLHDLSAPVTVAVPTDRVGRTCNLKAGEPGLWPLVAGDAGGEAVVSVQGVKVLAQPLGFWTGARVDALRARDRAVRPAHLCVLPGLVLDGAGIAAAAARLGVRPVTSAADVVRLRMDPWRQVCAALAPDDARRAARGAVLIPLSEAPYDLGLSREQLRERLLAAAQAVVVAGGVPVFVLPATVDLQRPLFRRYALTMLAMARDLDLPLVDLREAAP